MTDRKYHYVEKITAELFDIKVEDLYLGTGNIPVKRAMARNLCLYLLHDRFSFFYKQLAEITGMTQRSIMRCVRKARIYTSHDKEYIKFYKILLGKLSINDIIW